MAIKENSPMIQTCPACGAAIDTTDAEPLARAACPKCGEKMRVERTFDHFVLVETLGVGGMSTVYKAHDTLLDRFVALKLLRKDLGGEKDRTSQLQQEARVAASVNHPNVIQVVSSGTDHGQFYVVMELVDYGSLDDLIEQRSRLTEEQVLESGIQVAKGLRAAYRQGLIHRDVKPANILFADEQTAKISDFGLAGVATQGTETEDVIWGTPYYVAPERLNSEPEDFRSDVYSLGATLFHAIAGKAPIEGDTTSALALRDLKNRPLDLRSIAPDVSPATASVFQRMIAPDPGQRFSSYDELVTALERAQRALKGLDDVDFARGRRQRWFLIGAALLIILAAIGLFFLAHKPH
jgi:serine/threonine protein kinase